MHIISVQNITVKYLQHVLLQNLSITIEEGQHWLITGQSGSGKTVILNVLAGLMKPFAGVIALKEGLGSKNITLVTSRHHFKDKTNTSTNMYYQQRYNSSDADQALTVAQHLESKQPDNIENGYWTIDKVTDLLSLQPLLSKELIKLSNGETKRLRLAAALLSQPQVLLLDDPLSGLDQQTQSRFNTILGALTDSGITVIMSGSGHEIPDVITHVAVLKAGTIVNSLPAHEYSPSKEYQDNNPDITALSSLVKEFPLSQHNWIVNMNYVHVKYDEHVILNNINWQVKPGDHWALFGHNGAGKSTLLSLINGDNPQAYANNIILFDKKRGTGESIWDIKKKTGFVSPELYQYFPTDQTALQVIESGYYDTQGLFRPSSASKRNKAMEWLEALHIEQYATQLLKHIPASAQRLCLLARALIKMPDLLILDEPCQGLDKQQRIHFNQLIDVIMANTGTTLIYVTHYANELPTCINKILALKNGEIVDAAMV
ncbi:ATP-binding cassette domain-containing protein [Mucilaginibacter aquatilis]|uniref:ATP-binding cassette domain-containing protein n=1 Tax=Mucilaginibacter aquatilis TaxID=1517760 RepID=A0A6I4I306_9SPHI|nr:ATP-binding cassette domain-containing protein [Mucilaginibacter aquatilis]MVN89512.1 ATP-binding cassette domain-containing protein [Mucilaginibacter aquatilis]